MLVKYSYFKRNFITDYHFIITYIHKLHRFFLQYFPCSVE